ncbi:MAG: polysaccharide biosynthesis C-terminal domain-containing protein [Chitinophagales bacterium]
MLKKIIKSSFLFTIGNMMPLLTSVVLLFPYTTYLQPGLYGELALYIAFTLLVQYLANYGLDNYVGIHHYEYKKDQEQLKKFIGSVVGALMVIGAGLTIVFLVSGAFIFDSIFKGELPFFPFGFMAVLTGVFNSLFRTYINFLFYRDKPKRHLYFNIFNFVVTLVLCIGGLLLFPDSIIGPMWGRLLSGALIFLLAGIFFIREYGLHFDTSMLKGLHRFCIPVAGFYVLTWVLAYINNYILNDLATLTDVGIYDFALKCVLLIEITQTSLAQTFNPKIYDMWSATGMRKSSLEENRYHNVFTMLSVVMIALSILLLPLVVQLLVKNESYYAIFQYLPVLCISFVFRPLYNAFYNSAIFYKKTIALPRVLLFSSILQIVLAIILIKQFDIWGAVWSYALIKPIQVLLFWIECRSIFKFKFNPYKMIVLPLGYTLLIVLLFFLNNNASYYFNGAIQLLAVGIVTLVIFRKELPRVKTLFLGK